MRSHSSMQLGASILILITVQDKVCQLFQAVKKISLRDNELEMSQV